jgi:L-lactate dehydrogenase complex protein LldG
LPAEWTAQGLDVRKDTGAATPRELDTIPAVVTGSAVAVSETGTIVLDGSARCGRRAITLVPDTHVCVVATRDIVQTVPEGLRRLDPARPLTLISGPSATSDIELSRVEGVHGPRTLVVVLAG